MTYVDYEMSEDDLLERLDDMGFTPDRPRAALLLPAADPATTRHRRGGTRAAALARTDHSVGVVIDTVGHAVEGEENAADTYHGFWQYTGRRLKRAGIGLARLDHEGHEAGRYRGYVRQGR